MLGGSGGVEKLCRAKPHTTSPHHHCYRVSHLHISRKPRLPIRLSTEKMSTGLETIPDEQRLPRAAFLPP
eukprot:gene26340-biopygen15943